MRKSFTKIYVIVEHKKSTTKIITLIMKIKNLLKKEEVILLKKKHLKNIFGGYKDLDGDLKEGDQCYDSPLSKCSEGLHCLITSGSTGVCTAI